MIQWVLPSIDPAYRRECVASLHPSIQERTLIVDNGRSNRGVAASWNLGRDRAINERADWLVILSESVRFGTAGGQDLEHALDGAGTEDTWIDTMLGWHLVAFRTDTLRRTGAFDENFWPAYLEDTDYLVRLHLAGYASPRENDLPHRWLAALDCGHVETEHSLRAGFVGVSLSDNRDYYRVKWGAEDPGHKYERPFDRTDVDWTFWPPARQRP